MRESYLCCTLVGGEISQINITILAGEDQCVWFGSVCERLQGDWFGIEIASIEKLEVIWSMCVEISTIFIEDKHLIIVRQNKSLVVVGVGIVSYFDVLLFRVGKLLQQEEAEHR